MKNNNIKLKELPEDINFATFNSDNQDIILGEYLIVKLLYNGYKLKDILEQANEIKNKREREDVKKIIIKMVVEFIAINPNFDEALQRNNTKLNDYNLIV